MVEFSETGSVSLLSSKNVYFTVGNAEWQEPKGPIRLGLTMAHLQTNSDMAMMSFMLNLSETNPTALLMF